MKGKDRCEDEEEEEEDKEDKEEASGKKKGRMIYAKSLQANFSHFERDGCEWIGIMTDAAMQKSAKEWHFPSLVFMQKRK